MTEMPLLNWSFMYGVLTGTSVYVILKWIYHCLNDEKEVVSDSLFDDCILFSPDKCTVKCLREFSSSASCVYVSCPPCNFKKFLALISSAKHSLDICVYLISSDEIADAIINVFKRGIFVRIIVDKQMSDEAYGSKMYVFIKQHIPVKVSRSEPIMHNKFVIIDGKTLVTGSFNWTRQATLYNYENGIITQQKKILEKFNQYFEFFWQAL